jgi:hypothetical protein
MTDVHALAGEMAEMARLDLHRTQQNRGLVEWAYRVLADPRPRPDRIEVGEGLCERLRHTVSPPLKEGQLYTLLGVQLTVTSELSLDGWRTLDWAGFVLAEGELERTTG